MLSENEKKQKQDRNVPQLRFAGFTGEWEQRKLGDLYKRNSERNEKQFSETKTISIATMHFNKNGNGASEDSLLNYKVLRIGDIAYEGHTNKQFAFGRFVLNDIGDGIMSPRFMTLRPIKKMDTDFWKHYIHYEPLMRRILVKSTKAGTMMNELVVPEFLNEEILIPKKEEQAKIGVFFKKLEHLIILQQCKLDLLKQKKKGYLQKMFPKENENVPELRFSGYADAWEQRKLGELGSVAMNKRIFKNQTSKNSDVPFYKIGTFGKKPDSFITRELFEEYKQNYPYPEVGDILISASGSIGRTITYEGEDAYFQDSNIVWLKHDEKLNNSFLKQFYLIVKWQGLEGSTIKRLYNKNILNTEIYFPSVKEQQLIGSFFEKIDHLITLHQRKLDMLKERKKAYLQKMFI